MTEVWFYLLPDAHRTTRQQFMIKFCETAYRRDRQAVILCRDGAEAEHLDLAIWNASPSSFIPHSIDHQHPAPLQLITQSLPERGDLLLNLTDQLLVTTGYQRIVEIINPDNREASRSRWRHYQQQGLMPELKPISREVI